MAEQFTSRRAIPEGADFHYWEAPDGWKLRVFHWPSASSRPRGSILFQTGRGDIIEKYLELLHHWHDEGWQVSAFDWRGQGGSGRLTEAGNCGHIDDFATYIIDFQAFYAEWAASAPGPHVVMGHSMGGYLVLRALAEDVIQPDAAVLVAPMLGFKSFIPSPERFARFMGNLGDPKRPAWKSNEKPYTRDSRSSLLTHDRDRYDDELYWQATRPELVTGPPSWHWLAEAFRATKMLAAHPNLTKIRVPVLMLIANADGLVDGNAARKLGAKLHDARIVAFGKESAHEILRECDPVRNRAIGEIDIFLAARAQLE